MVQIKHNLVQLGHEVILPRHAEGYADGSIRMENNCESTRNKIEGNLLQKYFEIIQGADDEIFAMQPVILEGDLLNLKLT